MVYYENYINTWFINLIEKKYIAFYNTEKIREHKHHLFFVFKNLKLFGPIILEKLKVAESCLTFVTPWNTVHGILQAKILEWVAFPFSSGSSQSRDQTQVSRIAGRFFTTWATREALILEKAFNNILSFFLLINAPCHILCFETKYRQYLFYIAFQCYSYNFIVLFLLSV